MNTDDPDPTTAGTLLVSDIDDTLTGDLPAMAKLIGAIEADRPRLRIVLNSSRPYESVRVTLRDVFPASFKPDGVITAMGTQVRVGGEVVDAWDKRFSGWPREKIMASVVSLGHRPHDDEFQTAYKASFAVPRGAQAEVAKLLESHGLPCRIIASGESDFDILPPDAGKDHATRFVTQHMGYGPEQLIVAGDSANDLAMFRIAPRCIAVGNARSELIDAAPNEKLYHAKAHHAAGVHEGLVHYRCLPGAINTVESA
jgi:sucrose-6F-phosphate phosphohydrolase